MERTSLGRKNGVGKHCCSLLAFPLQRCSQIQAQPEPFLLLNAQWPKIPLAGKAGPFLMELLVHRNIPYCRKPPPDLPWKKGSKKIRCRNLNSHILGLFWPEHDQIPRVWLFLSIVGILDPRKVPPKWEASSSWPSTRRFWVTIIESPTSPLRVGSTAQMGMLKPPEMQKSHPSQNPGEILELLYPVMHHSHGIHLFKSMVHRYFLKSGWFCCPEWTSPPAHGMCQHSHWENLLVLCEPLWSPLFQIWAFHSSSCWFWPHINKSKL